MRRAVLLALALIVAGCHVPSGEPGEAEAPQVGKADSTDRADHECTVVLRRVVPVTEHLLGPSGPPSTTYEVTVEVAAARDVRGAAVLYRTTGSQGRWYTVTPEGAAPGVGFTTYRFVLRHFLAGGEALVVDLIPYVWLADGARVFDHNRVADEDNYQLAADNDWTVPADATCGGASGGPTAHFILSYPGFGTVLEDGPVAAGGTLKVTYDGRRLRETQDCLGAQGAVSATTISMFHAIDDGAPTQTTVEQYSVNYAAGCPESPCVTQQVTEPEIRIPDGATSISLWFACVPGFSYGAPENWKYDSNFGANYVLSIE